MAEWLCSGLQLVRRFDPTQPPSFPAVFLHIR